MRHFVGGNKFSKVDEIEEEAVQTSYLKKMREANPAAGSGLASRGSQENLKPSKGSSQMHASAAHPRGLASRGSSQLTHHAKHAK
jgi:hypothetical protein